ncbi:MAG: flagellar filament capping protein FliD [Candidatus Eiseniibacteriota bacterium]
MSTNFIAGIVSGLDTTALIDALVTSRSGPVLLLQQRQAQKTAQLSAWKSFEAILVSLKVETDRLGRSTQWSTPRVTVSDEEILTAAGSSKAALASYEFAVGALAEAHQIQSVAFASRTDAVGGGTLSITVGTRTTDLTVAAGATLEDLAAQIEEAEVGASASIVRSDDGAAEAYYLVLTSDETGTSSAISVTSSLSGGTDPVLATEVRAAANAQLLLGGDGGLALQSTTNTFEDVVDGVDVTVRRVTDPGESVTVDVGRDTEGLETAVRTFVDRYNAMISFVNGQYAFDPEVGTRPPLLGDASLTAMTSEVRGLVTRALPGGTGSVRTLFAAGIRSGSDGTLTFDVDEFRDALAADFDAVANLFQADAAFDAAGIEWISAPDAVNLAERELEVVISQAATRAQLAGSSISLSGGLVIDDSNDEFRISIDGIASETLSIAHGTYTDGDLLAAAIRTAIQDSANLGELGVRVSFVDGGSGSGSFTFTSNRYGEDGTILLVTSGSSAFATDLGLSSVFGQTAAGTDVAGTIGGVTAEGLGQTLSVPDDAEEIGGISFLVTATTATTFQASFTEGVGRAASRLLDSLTAAGTGRLSRLEGSVQRLIERIDEDVAAKREQLEAYRARLVRHYTRLETTLGQLQSQGAFLSAQFAAGSNQGGFGLNTKS